MILVLGASSYIGQSFANELRRRRASFVPLTREAFDFYRFDLLFDYVRAIKPELIINAEGRPESSDHDEGDAGRMEMLRTNVLLPQTVSRVCAMTRTPLGHISSGSIYSSVNSFPTGGAELHGCNGAQALRPWGSEHLQRFHGFRESDEPNFTFRFGRCNFFSGTKALAEEAIRNTCQGYIWRLRHPFNEQDGVSNFLSQLQSVACLGDAPNSFSHLDDCVRACLDLWDRHAPFGVYNVVNQGSISIREVSAMIQRFLRQGQWPTAKFEQSAVENALFLAADCVLDISKLLSTGIEIRNVKEALEAALTKWQQRGVEPLGDQLRVLPPPV